MADPSSNPSNNPAPPGEGLSMERRFLIALILMGLILFLTQYLYKPTGPPPKSALPAQTEPQAAELTKEAPKEVKVIPAVPLAVGQVSASKEETQIVDTDLYRVVLSNRGAVVTSWVLKKYQDGAGKPLDLVNADAAPKAGFPFSLAFSKQGPPANPNQALFVAKPASNGLGVDYEFSDGRMVVRKSFLFLRDRYLLDVASSVAVDGKELPHVLTWRGGFGDRIPSNHAASLHSLHFDLAQNKLIVEQAKVAKNGPVSVSGSYSFAGIEDTYFAAVALPADRSSFEIRAFSDQVSPAPGQAETPYLGAGVGGAGENHFSMFVGPKDIDILKRVNPKLEQVVNFGWFGILAKPLFLSVNWVNNRFVHDYGWAIVLVTVVINFLLLPLKYTSLKSMKKMQLLQPQIAEINAKYKGIGMRDPRKSEQNQEVMDLYKKNSVNPMGGCMPMLLPIPFFIAFYTVLTVAIEMRGAHWLWVTDLSQPEHIPIRILPVTMIVTQFIMQKMTPATTMDPAQQKMMMFMPLMFGFMFYGLSSGVVLYWLTGNLVGIAQQMLFNRISAPALALPPPPKAAAKKSGRK
jgi:YidC/Oxa1 family membrane protein insertase